MLKKSKLMIALLLATLFGAVNSFAAVTFDNATKSFGGTFDLSPFYSAIGIIIGAIAIVASIRLALGAFKRVT